MNGAVPPPSPDQQILMDALRVVASAVTRGLVGAMVIVAVTSEGVLIAEHIAEGVDPHLVRGYLLGVQDRLHEKYIQKTPPPPILAPDGSVRNG